MDLESKFREQWPEMFRDVYCGFYLPERWEELVWALCERIDNALSAPWFPKTAVRVVQVKEKFGGLRFYYDWELTDEQAKQIPVPGEVDSVHNYITGLVSMAEAASFLIK